VGENLEKLPGAQHVKKGLSGVEFPKMPKVRYAISLLFKIQHTQLRHNWSLSNSSHPPALKLLFHACKTRIVRWSQLYAWVITLHETNGATRKRVES
jgi:hypothetical protein